MAARQAGWRVRLMAGLTAGREDGQRAVLVVATGAVYLARLRAEWMAGEMAARYA